MKRWMIITAMVISIKANSQEGFAIGIGGIGSYLQFTPFKEYVVTYNNQFNSSLEKPLDFNPIGVGYEGIFQYRIGKLYTAIRVGKSSTFASKATFASGDRVFKFRNYAFDVVTGFTLGELVTPYITLTINSMNIDTYFVYPKGFESYGSERPLSGIYTSNKLYSVAGLRFEKAFGSLGFYLDASYPLIAKTYLGGSFDKNAIQTDSPYFPSDNTTYGDLVVDNALPETYRNIRLGIGILFYLNKN
jgi:hypothetical protein